MPLDRFLIAPLDKGLENYVKPWLIPDQAFAELTNAYVWRGRIKKRFGTRLMGVGTSQRSSRLRIAIGTTGGALTIPTGSDQLAIGQMFSIGSDMFYIYQLGANVVTLSTNGSITCTINSAVNPNTVSFVGAAAGQTVYWYPSRPVMGLLNYDVKAVNDEKLYAFDTRFAYEWLTSTGGWERLGDATWSGDNKDFFWGANYRGELSSGRLLWVTNFKSTGTISTTDLIRYWDGSAWNSTSFNPRYLSGDNRIYTARIIIQFKGRLILMNTWESVNSTTTATNFVNRIRYSQVGSPLEDTAWMQPTETYGKGGFIDLPTNEQIISAQILKDRLLIFCESSTWELVATGNQLLPFVEQNINIELGVESPQSVVVFDKVLLGIGNVGIHACNGLNVERIDQTIPDEVFQIHDGSDGPLRVQGIRDYYTELVYWTFPNQQTSPTYPNRVLVYNYITGSWAFNNDTFTTFGYFQTTPTSTGITWADATRTWASAHVTWGTASSQAKFRQVVGGNQEGYVLIIDRGIGRNAPSLQITTMSVSNDTVTLVIKDHNLGVGDYILVESAQGITGLNNNIYRVNSVSDGDTITVILAEDQSGAGTYTGGGTAARVSNPTIVTKEYNFYLDQGRNFYVEKVDFFVERTKEGQVTVDYYVSTSDEDTLTAASATGSLLGTNVLETSAYSSIPFEATMTRLWHPVYLQADGEFVQLKIFLSDNPDQRTNPLNTQIRNPSIALSNFELHAMNFYCQPTASRLQ